MFEMTDTANLEKLAKLVRYFSLFMTTKAGSGHLTSSLSATDIMVALFFNKLRYDLADVKNPNNDRVIFSKGHASPLFYALYAAAGVLDEADLEKYRKFGSELEGHPRPVFKYAEVATGSLGQGLSIGLGMALAANLDSLSYLTYVLMGDSEVAEGSIWEAIQLASYYKVGNLVGIIDVNRLGQSTETMLGYNVDAYKARVEAFGWEAHIVDGHNFADIQNVLDSIDGEGEKPQMIIAKTIKGKGISFLEDKEGWHGKALPQEDYEKAVAELGEIDKKLTGKIKKPVVSSIKYQVSSIQNTKYKILNTKYQLGEDIATRKAYGEALAALGYKNTNIVSLDAEVKNSTFAEIFKDAHPERFFEMFIAEQNMVGTALGLSRRGKIPFVSTFTAFFTRAFDQIRMSVYSEANVKFVGSHAGVSIGEDGPSQMGLEDFAMFRTVFGSTVLCPADAVAAEKLVEVAVSEEGIFYIRTARFATPVIYDDSEEFKVGGSKVVKSADSDKLTIVACGVTLFEAIKAADELEGEGMNVRVIDAYSIKPIDEEALKAAASETGGKVVTVEDHYFEGGLGDAVLNVFANVPNVSVHKLAVSKMPTSGKADELLDYEGISSKGIVEKVKEILGN
ncbi:MAG: transketolase [Candidatus Curtissbacteria bacterium]|nr:transketolase [Candidatus Curtissbacteria bacterium]